MSRYHRWVGLLTLDSRAAEPPFPALISILSPRCRPTAPQCVEEPLSLAFPAAERDGDPTWWENDRSSCARSRCSWISSPRRPSAVLPVYLSSLEPAHVPRRIHPKPTRVLAYGGRQGGEGMRRSFMTSPRDRPPAGRRRNTSCVGCGDSCK